MRLKKISRLMGDNASMNASSIKQSGNYVVMIKHGSDDTDVML